MLHQRVLLVCVLTTMAGTAAVRADSGVQADLPSRARGAERIVVAEVSHVQPVYQRNEFGDELIVSRATLRIERVLKGRSAQAGESVVLDVEGGTIGEITLRVSDLPRIARGEKAVFFLERNRQGRIVPHQRGLGILKLDAAGRVEGSALTVEGVRRAIAAAQ